MTKKGAPAGDRPAGSGAKELTLSVAPQGNKFKFSDQNGPAAGAGFASVTRANHCPVCGAASWCQVSPTVAICRRVKSDADRLDSDGVPYSIHPVDKPGVGQGGGGRA